MTGINVALKLTEKHENSLIILRRVFILSFQKRKKFKK